MNPDDSNDAALINKYILILLLFGSASLGFIVIHAGSPCFIRDSLALHWNSGTDHPRSLPESERTRLGSACYRLWGSPSFRASHPGLPHHALPKARSPARRKIPNPPSPWSGLASGLADIRSHPLEGLGSPGPCASVFFRAN